MSVSLSFVSPPPGLAPHTAFALEPVPDADNLFTLRASADPALRLYAVDPAGLVAEYAPRLTDAQAEELQLGSAEDALLLVVARPSEGGISVNLKAPLVVNTRTGVAGQFILDDQDYPVSELLR